MTVVFGCVSDGQEGEHRELVDRFVVLCDNNQLLLNINKTKKMLVDFRKIEEQAKRYFHPGRKGGGHGD